MADTTKKKRKPNLPTDTEWCDATKKWYNTWKRSSRTDDWDDTQWHYLLETAMVHQLAFTTYNPMALSELRKREQFMGLNFDAPTAVVVVQQKEETPIDRYSRRRESRKSSADNTNSS